MVHLDQVEKVVYSEEPDLAVVDEMTEIEVGVAEEEVAVVVEIETAVVVSVDFISKIKIIL